MNSDTVAVRLNGIKVKHAGDTIFIPLPRELWRKAGNGVCNCPTCKVRKSKVAYWDTLVVSAVPMQGDCTWTVHFPELHSA